MSYIDIKRMQERIDEKERQQSEQANANWQVMTDSEIREQNEANELFAKVMLSKRKDAEEAKAKALEEAQAKAIQEIENRFEDKGVKSEKQKQLDEAYKGLLDGLVIDDEDEAW
ncbi:MAG: hypothetical protein LBM95_06665 [Lactobacillales bacterium]|jgi:hypothetical protein|nr:hypothetical protein [Lactobacillales bacterium]